MHYICDHGSFTLTAIIIALHRWDNGDFLVSQGNFPQLCMSTKTRRLARQALQYSALHLVIKKPVVHARLLTITIHRHEGSRKKVIKQNSMENQHHVQYAFKLR